MRGIVGSRFYLEPFCYFSKTRLLLLHMKVQDATLNQQQDKSLKF